MPGNVQPLSIRKTGEVRAGYDFVLSTPSVDSYGDIVKGPWDLKRFNRNPIALWMHDTEHPIGVWTNVRLENDATLVGTLRLAAPGTSDKIDTLRSLIDQGILKAVSVGFQPRSVEPIDPKKPMGGYVLSDNELHEVSLVSIPANADALARALDHCPASVRRALSPKSGDCVSGSACAAIHSSRQVRSASSSSNRNTPVTLAERIKIKQAELNQLRDDMAAITDAVDDTGALSDEQQVQFEDLSTRIEKSTADLATLTRAEQATAKIAAVPQTKAAAETPRIQLIDNKPAGQRAIQAIAAIVKARGLRVDPVQVARDSYRDQQDIEILVRAATDPATTTDSTWASKLIQETWGGFLELLRDASVYPRIPGLRVSLDGTRNIPVQNGRGALAGGFVAENGAIPVKEGSIGTTSLAPKKLAVISAYTAELARRSMPSIEAIIRGQIVADTAEALDTAFLGSAARTTTVPAGLQDTTETGAANVNAVTNVATGAHGCTVREVISDTSALLLRVWAIRANAGAWIMNPAQRLALEDKQDATTGHFVFREEVQNGRFRGYPIVESTNVTAGIVAFVADSAMAFGQETAPMFDMSDSATLHFENASPVAIGTAGTPATVAAPAISLFQQDLMALRMIWHLDWRVLRQGGVQVLTAASGW